MTEKILLEKLRRTMKRTGRGGQKALADQFHLSNQFINDMLKGRRSIPAKILEFLGYERKTILVRVNGR